jgi:hypothetical protein
VAVTRRRLAAGALLYVSAVLRCSNDSGPVDEPVPVDREYGILAVEVVA